MDSGEKVGTGCAVLWVGALLGVAGAFFGGDAIFPAILGAASTGATAWFAGKKLSPEGDAKKVAAAGGAIASLAYGDAALVGAGMAIPAAHITRKVYDSVLTSTNSKFKAGAAASLVGIPASLIILGTTYEVHESFSKRFLWKSLWHFGSNVVDNVGPYAEGAGNFLWNGAGAVIRGIGSLESGIIHHPVVTLLILGAGYGAFKLAKKISGKPRNLIVALALAGSAFGVHRTSALHDQPVTVRSSSQRAMNNTPRLAARPA